MLKPLIINLYKSMISHDMPIYFYWWTLVKSCAEKLDPPAMPVPRRSSPKSSHLMPCRRAGFQPLKVVPFLLLNPKFTSYSGLLSNPQKDRTAKFEILWTSLSFGVAWCIPRYKTIIQWIWNFANKIQWDIVPICPPCFHPTLKDTKKGSDEKLEPLNR